MGDVVAKHPADEDLDAMLEVVLPFAKQCIEKRGRIYPFGATVDLQGRPAMVALGDEDEDPDAATEALKRILGGHAEAGEVRATLVCRDLVMRQEGSRRGQDVISVEFDHISGKPLRCVWPYRRRFFRRTTFADDCVVVPLESYAFPT